MERTINIEENNYITEWIPGGIENMEFTVKNLNPKYSDNDRVKVKDEIERKLYSIFKKY